MDNHNRIVRLEEQVRDLSDQVDELIGAVSLLAYYVSDNLDDDNEDGNAMFNYWDEYNGCEIELDYRDNTRPPTFKKYLNKTLDK